MAVPILSSAKQWTCPNCSATDVTHEAQPHTRYHACPGLRGISAPMVQAGVKAKVEAFVREDYIGKDIVSKDDSGRPIMSVVTTRDDGTDCAVFAPTAVASTT